MEKIYFEKKVGINGLVLPSELTILPEMEIIDVKKEPVGASVQ